jgi:hypothetical protein
MITGVSVASEYSTLNPQQSTPSLPCGSFDDYTARMTRSDLAARFYPAEREQSRANQSGTESINGETDQESGHEGEIGVKSVDAITDQRGEESEKSDRTSGTAQTQDGASASTCASASGRSAGVAGSLLHLPVRVK